MPTLLSNPQQRAVADLFQEGDTASSDAPRSDDGRRIAEAARNAQRHWEERKGSTLYKRERMSFWTSLETGWNRRGAAAPTFFAVKGALALVEMMVERGQEPTRVAPSAVGGVGVTRRAGDRMAYVEFYNSGGACALLSDEGSDEQTFRLRWGRDSLNQLVGKIEEYLNGSPAGRHADG
jgi:hypothetical protein